MAAARANLGKARPPAQDLEPPEGQLLKSGWMERGRVGTEYQKRWICLHADPCLASYEDAECQTLRGNSTLRGATVLLSEDKLQVVTVDQNGRTTTMRFRAISDHEAQEWGAAIMHAISSAPPARLSVSTLAFLEQQVPVTACPPLCSAPPC